MSFLKKIYQIYLKNFNLIFHSIKKNNQKQKVFLIKKIMEKLNISLSIYYNIKFKMLLNLDLNLSNYHQLLFSFIKMKINYFFLFY